ncbi:hypothetical protein [Fuerstiella marisgermanici]|uniref:Uncharacterized protein n=1 Tax=Fuerstiella marisgermanici TaxID=1891926 RepID=A0A1P8WH94_9PLAN|nr:hypothetical protein [Fuerstiella marisgermanici]APZ93413.1 hypothetical protein Fuma_03030 [Fuerstiella marisgermanici]
MSLRNTLEEVAANLVVGFSNEIDNSLKADCALIGSQPALQDAGAEIAAAIMGRPRTAQDSIGARAPIPPMESVFHTIPGPRVIEVEAIRRLS